MKKLLLLLLFSGFGAFAQLTKEENLSSFKTNEIITGGQLLASAEIFDFHNEIIFYAEDLGVFMFFSLDNKEFADLGELLTGYDVTKRDKYSLHMRAGGSLYIGFEEVNGYLKIKILARLGNEVFNFPDLNRVQFGRLFSK